MSDVWSFSGDIGEEFKSDDFILFESLEQAKQTFEQSGNRCCLIIRMLLGTHPFAGAALGQDFEIVSTFGTRTNGWRDFTIQPEKWGDIWG